MATVKLIAMSITVRAQQNAITEQEKQYDSQEKLNSWERNVKRMTESNVSIEVLYTTSAILMTPTAKVL